MLLSSGRIPFLSQLQDALVEFERLVLFRNSLWRVFGKNMIRLMSQVMISMCRLPNELWESSSGLCLRMQESRRKN